MIAPGKKETEWSQELRNSYQGGKHSQGKLEQVMPMPGEAKTEVMRGR
jgi:hypothetical protein